MGKYKKPLGWSCNFRSASNDFFKRNGIDADEYFAGLAAPAIKVGRHAIAMSGPPRRYGGGFLTEAIARLKRDEGAKIADF
jgi:hypothetical protein